MKASFIKFGSYLVLIFGLIIGLVSILLAVGVFLNYPEANIGKKSMIAAAFLIAGLIFTILGLAFFESSIETQKIEKEIEQIEKKLHIN